MVSDVLGREDDDLGLGSSVSDDGLGNDDDLDFGSDDFGYDGSVAPMEKHSELLKYLTDFEPYLRELVQGWLGLVWSEEDERFVNDESNEPIMNLKCAMWCISYLKTYARKNNIITTLDRKEYNQLISDVIDVIWLNVGNRADLDFGISSDGDIIRICNELEHATILILTGAGEGKYNQLLKDTHKTGEHVGINPSFDGGGVRVVGKKKGLFKSIVERLRR